MKRVFVGLLLILLNVAVSTNCFAGCSCDNWVNRGGYCVNYIKSKIPAFPIPVDIASIKELKNKEIKDIARGDVAIFDLGRYWHVAYVENVHLDQHGHATAIDVSEMNFGGPLSFEDYKAKWAGVAKSDWNQAACCGVTKNFGEIQLRENIPLGALHQVWSPEHSVFQLLDRMLHSTGIVL